MPTTGGILGVNVHDLRFQMCVCIYIYTVYVYIYICVCFLYIYIPGPQMTPLLDD